MFLLADRTVTQYDRLLVCYCCPSVQSPSVALCIVDAQGRSRELKVVQSCS